MRVGVVDRVVPMLVHVGLLAVHVGRMLVIVMVVVVVPMVMHDRHVLVIVDVPLRQVKPDAEAHQGGGDQERERHRVP